MRYPLSLALLLLNAISAAVAGGVQTTEKLLEPVVVEENRLDQIGVANSANQGVITQKQLENRPLSRTAELLEMIPGVIVTQHSGDGKANQYYVHGFNLDHGTDLRITVLGMPVNMPSHAHGQGYSDLNFLIPELVESIPYKKELTTLKKAIFPRLALPHSITCAHSTRGLPVSSWGSTNINATGKEVGMRLTGLIPGLQTSLSLWRLDLVSELVFVGDAGTTEAGRPSRRTGIEIANYYVAGPGWIIDADLAWSRANFTNQDAAGNRIPGAIERTASIGLLAQRGKWPGGLRLRYFGSRPLIEDNSVRSSSSAIINTKLGYAVSKTMKLTAEILNLANREVSDVDYYYESRLRNEAASSFDVHAHPAEPRTVRIGMLVNF